MDNKELEAEVSQMHNFQTSVRGLSWEYMVVRRKLSLDAKREVDPYHNVYVGPVGVWMPWEPDAYKTGRVEYLEEQLNELRKREKNSNDEYAKRQFDQRVLNSEGSYSKNVKLAETGNKLTQNINEQIGWCK